MVDKVKRYHQIPPKVEYSLTEKGVTLLPVLEMMSDWGTKNMEP
jgi:DNA-binding HxlR family transcriptional regulator